MGMKQALTCRPSSISLVMPFVEPEMARRFPERRIDDRILDDDLAQRRSLMSRVASLARGRAQSLNNIAKCSIGVLVMQPHFPPCSASAAVRWVIPHTRSGLASLMISVDTASRGLAFSYRTW